MRRGERLSVEFFKARALDYDAWYVKHPSLYKLVLLAAARLGCSATMIFKVEFLEGCDSRRGLPKPQQA
jgi:hypothetical protein